MSKLDRILNDLCEDQTSWRASYPERFPGYSRQKAIDECKTELYKLLLKNTSALKATGDSCYEGFEYIDMKRINALFGKASKESRRHVGGEE